MFTSIILTSSSIETVLDVLMVAVSGFGPSRSRWISIGVEVDIMSMIDMFVLGSGICQRVEMKIDPMYKVQAGCKIHRTVKR